MELLQENLRFGALRIRFSGRLNSINEEIGLKKNRQKTKIDEIEKLKRKKETEIVNLFITDDKAVDFLLELNIVKRDIEEQLVLIEIKLEN